MLTTRGSRAQCKQLAFVQHGNAVGELDNGAHQVLDENDGSALGADGAHQANGIVDLGRVQA
jgi:hypothetical protein